MLILCSFQEDFIEREWRVGERGDMVSEAPPPPTPSPSFHAPLCPPPPSVPPTSASQFVASKIQVVRKVILFFMFMIMILLSFYFLFLIFFNFIFGKVECQNDHCNTPGFTYDSYNGGFNWTIHILPATRSFKVRFPKF